MNHLIAGKNSKNPIFSKFDESNILGTKRKQEEERLAAFLIAYPRKFEESASFLLSLKNGILSIDL